MGFRYTVKNIALQHDVNGFVRNLPDGRVEVVMEGPDQEIAAVIDGVSDRMDSYIKHVDRSNLPATGEFEYFQIRH